MFGGVKRADSTNSAALHRCVAQIRAELETIAKPWDAVDREEIYHYTSVSAAHSILKDRILWAFDVLSMNDGSEFIHAVSVVDEVLMELWNVLPIHFAESFRPKKLLLAGRTWYMFATCFCSEPDLLSQWRAYACNAQGVAVGFRAEPLHELGGNSHEFALIPIQYDAAHLRSATQRMCDFGLRLAASESLPYYEVEIFWSEMVLALLNATHRFKNPSFAEEKEWRALRLETDECPTLLRNVGGQERRYIHLHFRPEMVSQIVLGPLADPALETQLRQFLDSNGLEHVQIRRSRIPLRAGA
jgi:hypothetical protein